MSFTPVAGEYGDRAVAIIGMTGRFPGAADLGAYWENVRSGRDSFTDLTRDRLLAEGVPESWIDDADYVRVASVLDGADCFDADLFGVSPHDAALVDPQHRLFLEMSWAALEHAGYLDARARRMRVGVFGGAGGMLAGYAPLLFGGEPLRHPTASQEHLGNEKDFLTTRVSHRLNLTGPSLAVQTSCSTSLVSVHLACRSLLDGECEMALAGAVSVRVPQQVGYFHRQGMLHSRTGRPRPFDAAADGTVFGSGGGVLVLKALADAVRDGDTVHAVIRGTAINNDGGEKLTYASPSMEGILEAARGALKVSGVDPGSLAYLEAQGSALPLSDAVEITALSRAVEGARCAVGSAKSVVGHLEAASGMAGLLKTVLALKNGVIPPSPYFTAPHPRVRLDESGLYVNREPLDWPEGTRFAAVNSFAIGGTNAFAVLEGAPAPAPSSAPLPQETIVLSARTEDALRELAGRWSGHLSALDVDSFGDTAYTSAVGRRALRHRLSVVAQSPSEAATRIDAWLDGAADVHGVDHGPVRSAAPKVAFAFPEPGSHFASLADELFRDHPGFRSSMARMTPLFQELTGCTPQDALADPQLSDRPELMQPALVAVELALAELWESWGVRPGAVVGHGLGEYAAAAVAGVLSAEDAVRLAAARGRIFADLPQDGLLGDLAGSLDRAAGKLEHRPPALSWAANLTGGILSPDEAGPEYWAQQLRAPLRFDDAVATLAEAGTEAFVEVGPGDDSQGSVWSTIQGTLARLDRLGLAIDWDAFHAPFGRRRVAGPTYPFARQRHWIAAAPAAPAAKTPAGSAAPPEDLAGYLNGLIRERLTSPVDSDVPLISLGMDSLAAVELRSRLQTDLGLEIPVADLLDHTLDALTARVCTDVRTQDPGTPVPAEHPLSYAQRSLLMLHQMDPDSASYNVAFTARFTGGFDSAVFHGALRSLVERHTALRSTFSQDDSAGRQIVHSRLEPDFAEVDARGWTEQQLTEAVRIAHREPFDLVAGPPLRVRAYQVAPGEAVILLSAHHVVCDFWSLGLMMAELEQLYLAQVEGRPAQLSERNVPYSDFVTYQDALIAGVRGSKARSYWHARLAGRLEPAEWPRFDLDQHQHQHQDQDQDQDQDQHQAGAPGGGSLLFPFPAELCDAVVALAKEAGATPYAVLLTAFQILVGRYTGQRDVLVGSPFAGRTDLAFAECVGNFVNPVVLRADLRDAVSFREQLGRTRRTVAEALDHQDYPFELLVSELAPRRAGERNPIFQAMFSYQKSQRYPAQAGLYAADEGAAQVAWAGLTAVPFRLAQQEDQLELALEVVQDGDRLVGVLKYRTSVFSASAAGRASEHYLTLLRAAIADPECSVADLPILSEADDGINRHRASAAVPVAAAPDDSLAVRFRQTAQRHADRIAVSCDGHRLSYAELDELAGRWTARLRAEGVGPGTRVALLLEPSLDTVVAIVAVQRAGAAYVVLDPSYPAARCRMVLDDSGARVVLTQPELAGMLDGVAVPVLVMAQTELPPTGAVDASDGGSEAGGLPGAGDVAYTVYTSGSTGTPKGIDVEHGNVLSLLEAMREYVVMDETAVGALFHSTGFDLSVWELWGTLLAGARLVVVPSNAARSPDLFHELLVKEQVTHIVQTPSALHGLSAVVRQNGAQGLALRHVFSCGEILPAPLARSAREWCGTLWNMYGPAETTVWVTAQPVRPEDCAGTGVPVGLPLANTRVHVLDEHGQPVPPEFTGELYIGGQCVARGYVNRPQLTKERFLDSPFEPEGRLYRTGDLARVNSQGLLEILGRVDNQVKISGYRVELEEVEAQLDRVPGVRRSTALVIGAGAGDARLVACVIPEPGQQLTESDLKAELRASLPSYMVPAMIGFFDAFPLNASQKVDRARLAEQFASAVAPTGDAFALSAHERTVAAVWQQVLHRQGIGREDNFFDLGGNSMLLMQVHQLLTGDAGTLGDAAGDPSLKVSELFRHPTVASLAARLGRVTGEHSAPGGPGAPTPRQRTQASEDTVRGRRLRARARNRPGGDRDA